MIYWLHLGNILYLLAYAVRDILWLRILTVVATLCLMPYYYCCSLTPLYAPIAWCSAFTLVNLVQIALLIMERRPVFLGEDELQLYRTVFRTLAPREFVKLLSIAEWKKATEGQALLRQDEPITQLAVISSGRGSVKVDGQYIAELGPGQFIGEMGYLTQENASASVVANVPVDYLSWPVDKLSAFLDGTPQLHLKLKGILGVDLVEKLRQDGFSSAHPSKVADMYQKGEFE